MIFSASFQNRNSKDPRYYANRGNCYKKMQNYKEAILDYRRALESPLITRDRLYSEINLDLADALIEEKMLNETKVGEES